MNIKTSQSRKRKLRRYYILVAFIALALIATVAYVVVTNVTNKKPTSQTTDVQAPTSPNTSPETNNESHSTDNSTKAEDTTPVTEPSASPPIAITASTQNGDVYQIRVLISTVTSSGTCTLSLERTGYTTVTKTAGVQAGPSSTTCKGFDVSVSELSAGDWNARVVFKNASQSAEVSQIVTIK